MRKLLTTTAMAAALVLGSAGAALAHSAPPCNDSDGDGTASGREYAEHHIVPLATTGGMGEDGHKPGSHQGFSACDPAER